MIEDGRWVSACPTGVPNTKKHRETCLYCHNGGYPVWPIYIACTVLIVAAMWVVAISMNST